MYSKNLTLTKNKKTIGILGGMGPVASANLYYKIIKIAQEKYRAEQDTDFPPMVIYNLPLVGFDETGFVNPALVKKQLIAGVKKLEQAGSDFIIIACNTVHYFYQEMQQSLKIPILSIIEETVKQVKLAGYKTIGVLGSESTNKFKLYQKALNNNGVKVLSATNSQQKIINKIILHIMSEKKDKYDIEFLKKIVNEFCRNGGQGVVLGCTELPLVIKQSDVGVKLFDSTEIIAEAALDYAKE